MLNKDIKYNLSTDYKRLHSLLKDGNTVIGIVPIEFCGNKSHEASKLTELKYSKESKLFHLGYTLFEIDLKKISFEKQCEKDGLRFIDI